jgi:hypothetical protein
MLETINFVDVMHDSFVRSRAKKIFFFDTSIAGKLSLRLPVDGEFSSERYQKHRIALKYLFFRPMLTILVALQLFRRLFTRRRRIY